MMRTHNNNYNNHLLMRINSPMIALSSQGTLSLQPIVTIPCVVIVKREKHYVFVLNVLILRVGFNLSPLIVSPHLERVKEDKKEICQSPIVSLALLQSILMILPVLIIDLKVPIYSFSPSLLTQPCDRFREPQCEAFEML